MEWGCYWPDPDLTLARSVGDTVVLGFPELMAPGPVGESTWPADTYRRLQTQGLGHILQGTPTLGWQDTFLNYQGQLERELCAMRATYDALAIPWPRAFFVGEEHYPRLQEGKYNHWPLVAQYQAEQKAMGADPVATYVTLATHLCMALERIAGLVHAMFPGVPVGHVEPFWEDDPAKGYNYRPYPRTYDFLGVDAYCPGIALRDFPAGITRAKWEYFVGRLYAASARYGKWLVMVPQTFADAADPIWTTCPTPEQLGWWLELPRRHPGIAASFLFCLASPGRYDRRQPRFLDLQDTPGGLLDAVQAFIARQRDRRGRQATRQGLPASYTPQTPLVPLTVQPDPQEWIDDAA